MDSKPHENSSSMQTLLEKFRRLGSSEKDREITDLSEKISNLRNEINSKNRDIEVLKETCNEKERDLSEEHRRFSEACLRCASLEKELEKAKNEANLKNTRIEELKECIVEKDHEIGAWNHRYELDRQELEKQGRLLEEERQKSAQLVSQLSDRQEMISSLSQTINDIREDKDCVIDELKTSLSEHRQWLSEAHQRGDCLEKKLKTVEMDVEAKKTEIDELKRRLSDEDSLVNALNIKWSNVKLLKEIEKLLEIKNQKTQFASEPSKKDRNISDSNCSYGDLSNTINDSCYERNSISNDLEKTVNDKELNLGEDCNCRFEPRQRTEWLEEEPENLNDNVDMKEAGTKEHAKYVAQESVETM